MGKRVQYPSLMEPVPVPRQVADFTVASWHIPFSTPVRKTAGALATAALIASGPVNVGEPIAAPPVAPDVVTYQGQISEPVRVPKSRKYAPVLAASSGYIHRQICFTVEVQVEANADDIRHRSDHDMASASGGIGNESGLGFDVAQRFIDVPIPKRADIDIANMILTPGITFSVTVVRTNIFAHAEDNSSQIVTDTNWHDVVDSNLTAAFVVWDNIPTFTDGVEISTPELKSIIQELVNRPGFNRIIHIIWLNDGSDFDAIRQRASHDIAPVEAAKLRVSFCLPDPGIPFDPAANMGWYNPFSEPVRFKKPIPIGSIPFYRLNPLSPRLLTPDKWYQPLSEPVRVPKSRKYAPVLAASSGYIHRQICFTVLLQVIADNDDGRKRSDGNWDQIQNSIGASGGNTFSNYNRWIDVPIPKNADIIVANIIYHANAAGAVTVVRTTIGAHKVADAPQIISAALYDIAAAALTALVDWDGIPAWGLDEEGPDTTSPDISSIIQEIVNLPAWLKDNALVLLQQDDGSDGSALRSPQDFNQGSEPAKLLISFCLPDSGIPFDPATNMGWYNPFGEPVRQAKHVPIESFRHWIIDAFQLTLPERTQLDKWYRPLSEPVRTKKPLPVGVAKFTFDPFPIPPVADPSVFFRWFRPFSEPVRVKKDVSASRAPAWWIDRLQLTLPERTQVDKWYHPLSEPVRVKKPLPVGAKPSHELDPFPRPPIVGIDLFRWYRPLSEPVRTRKPLPIGAVPFFWMDQEAKRELDILRWFAPFSEPVRVKKTVPASTMPSFWMDQVAKLEADILTWFAPLSEPVMVKKDAPASRMPVWEIGAVPIVPEITIDMWHHPLSEPLFRKKRSEAALIASGLYLQGPTVFIQVGQICGEFTLFAAIDGSHSLLVAVDGAFDLEKC